MEHDVHYTSRACEPSKPPKIFAYTTIFATLAYISLLHVLLFLVLLDISTIFLSPPATPYCCGVYMEINFISLPSGLENVMNSFS